MSERREKPTADWPFFWKPQPHGRGYWCRKVDGKQRSYGADDDQAIARYKVDMARQTLGIQTNAAVDTINAKTGANVYLNAQLKAVQNGTLKEGTFLETRKHLDIFVRSVGSKSLLSLLTPDDFEQVAAKIPPAKHRAREKLIIDVRAMYNHLVEKKHLTSRPDFGEGFRQLTMGEKRRVRAISAEDRGTRVPTIADIHAILTVAYLPRQRAELLLALNGGLGAGDLGELRLRHWRQDHHALDFPRPKTGIRRIIPLWDETEAALREWLASDERAKAAARADEPNRDRVFLSRTGQPITRMIVTKTPDGIPKSAVRVSNPDCRLAKLQKRAKVSGWSFYGLRALARHLWLGAPSSDPTLVRVLMGRQMSDGNDEYYLRALFHGSLRPYVDHAYRQLFPTGVPTGSRPDFAAYGKASAAKRAAERRRKSTTGRRIRKSESGPA